MSLFGKQSVAPSQIKKYTAMVGSLFSDMHIARYDDNGKVDLIKVPIQYGPAAIRNKKRDQEVKTGLVLPAMAFELSDIQIDEARKLGQHIPIQASFTKPGARFKMANTLQPVPHNITYRVYLRAKFVEDALQMLEQIVGAFNPYITVQLSDSTALAVDRDIPVKLESSYDYTDNYEASFEDERFVEITLVITVVGYIYKKIEMTPIVLEMELNDGNTVSFKHVATEEEIASHLQKAVPYTVELEMSSVSKENKK